MSNVDLNQDVILVTSQARSAMATDTELGSGDEDVQVDSAGSNAALEGLLFPWEWSGHVWEELWSSFTLEHKKLLIVHYYPGTALAALAALKGKFSYTCVPRL